MLIESPSNLTTPLASLVAVEAASDPPAPAGPGAIAAVTVTPGVLTGLPRESWIGSTGCCAKRTPLCAALEGGVVKASCPAAAAVMLKEALVPIASPVAAAVRV